MFPIFRPGQKNIQTLHNSRRKAQTRPAQNTTSIRHGSSHSVRPARPCRVGLAGSGRRIGQAGPGGRAELAGLVFRTSSVLNSGRVARCPVQSQNVRNLLCTCGAVPRPCVTSSHVSGCGPASWPRRRRRPERAATKSLQTVMSTRRGRGQFSKPRIGLTHGNDRIIVFELLPLSGSRPCRGHWSDHAPATWPQHKRGTSACARV